MLITPSSKRDLYEHARARWPSTLRIIRDRSNDAVVVTDPSDYDVYRAIENTIGANDEWSQLSAWAFHQALGIKIREDYNEKKLLVLTRSVTFEMFEKYIKSNLADESWEEERDTYNNLP